MIALPARDDAYDYEYFGKKCDAIVLMNYDQHWLTSPPGPIAAQDWFVENLRQVLEVCSRAEDRRGHCELCLRLVHRTEERDEPAAEFEHSGSAIARQGIGARTSS